MEQSFPSFNNERRPDSEPPVPKPRRSFFEMFSGRNSAEQTETKPSVKKAEAEPKIESKSSGKAEVPPKQLGEKLLEFLGMGQTELAKTGVELSSAEDQGSKPEPKIDPTDVVEQKASVIDKMVEGARNIGGGVLKLLGQTRENVLAADSREPGEPRTDIKPLDVAENKVQGAVDELNEAAADADWSGDNSGGGDFETPHWQLRAQQEAAYVNTQREVELAINAELHRKERLNRVRQIGMLAGASLIIGGEVYTWRKLRQLRKEQKRAHRRESEQQQDILERTRKIEELEQRQVSSMDHVQRQEYVHEVSAYASSQAEHIKDTAREVKDRLAERPELHPASWSVEKPVVRQLPEKPTVLEKPKQIVELAAEKAGAWLNNAKAQLTGGGLGGGFSRVVDNLKAAVSSQTAKKAKTTDTPYSPHDTVQSWLNGILLLLGVVLLIAILLAIF